jgi:uncharacterized protein involved in outer membrane biogenesis
MVCESLTLDTKIAPTVAVRWKPLLLVVVILIAAGAIGLFVWARAVLAGDAVRRTVETQLSRALGQPVTIGSVDATILPRVTMNLRDVAVGQPARITIARLHVGTDFRALLWRRIEHAAIRASGARLELPLPTLTIARAEDSSAGGGPVEIVSVDTVELTNAEIVSGGRILHADVDVVPAGRGLSIRRATLRAADTDVEISGAISDLSGPTGQLTASATAINVLDLVSFATDFSSGLGGDSGAGGSAAVDAVPMDLQVAIDARRATVGTLMLDALAGRARLTPARVTLQPIAFGVFDGKYSGALAFTPAQTPAYQVQASISGIDVAAVMAFAGSGSAVTGRLAGTIDLTGRTDQPVASARGRARVEIANGTVAGLNLVRTVVLAGSMRPDSQSQVSGVPARRPEPFDALTATFAIGGGVAQTDDLQFRSTDVVLTGAGALDLQRRTIDLLGRLQLSDDLSKQAGRDLLRYTQEDGRVTLPVVVTGAAGDLTVSVDVGDATRRAIANRAKEEVKKAISRVLGRIIK